MLVATEVRRLKPLPTSGRSLSVYSGYNHFFQILIRVYNFTIIDSTTFISMKLDVPNISLPTTVISEPPLILRIARRASWGDFLILHVLSILRPLLAQ